MATHVITDAGLWVDDIALNDISNSLEVACSCEAQDSTVWGHTARANKMGLFVLEVSADGYADFTTFDGELHALLAAKTARPITVSATTDDGSVAYFAQAVHTEFTPLDGSVGDMNAMSFAAVGAGSVGPIRGNIMAAEAARTSTGNGTARQLGAVAAGESVYATLHVLAASGTTPTLDVVIASDNASNFPSSTTRITFTQVTTSTGSQFGSAAGAITDDWWRVAWTIGGSSPSYTFVVAIGIDP